MYAVVKTSGRQYRVSPGDRINVERLPGTAGSTIDLTEVLMVGGDKTIIGSPLVSGAKVTVVVEEQFRGPKVLVFRKKRRQNFKKMKGHRSELTRLFVSEISSSAGSAKAETKPIILAADRVKRVVTQKADGVEKVAKKSAAPKAAKKKTTSKAKSGAKKATAKKKK